MSDFQVRSDAVDVEQIMDQIRRRVRDKRGVDYTEEQIRELANVRLEKFLDPKNLRSDLLEQFRKSRPAAETELPPPTYEFEEHTLYDTHRGLLRTIRRLLNPLLKLFFNPNQIVNVLHQQAELNRYYVTTTTQARVDRAAWNSLYYEVLHNLVLETTRAGIELKNLKMRVEALSSRLDFSERRVRALEGVVQYRPEAVTPRERRDQGAPSSGGGSVEPAGVPTAAVAGQAGDVIGGAADRGRRRRRRRGRRSGGGLPGQPGQGPAEDASFSEAGDSGADDGGPDDQDGPDDVAAPNETDPQAS